MVLGTGVTVKAVRRMHDQLVENRLRDSLTEHKYHDERAFQMMQVEDIYNEINSDGLSTVLNRFFNGFREMANQPENETVRSIVRENAKIVIKDIKTIRENLNRLSTNIDKKLASSVQDINTTLQGIGKLNIEISKLEAMNGETGDLRDQRDMAIKTLSEYFHIKTYSDDNGQFTVVADGVGTMLVGNSIQELAVGPSKVKGALNDFEGSSDLYFKTQPHKAITSGLIKGKIGADYEIRENELADLKDHVDTIAYELANMVNAIHTKGFTNKQIPILPNGQPDLLNAPKNASGVNFFKMPISKHRAAEYIDLSDAIKEDVGNIATAINPNSPGDNRVALAISKLQHEKVMMDGRSTVEEYFLKAIGNVGLLAGKATIDADHASGILAQANAVRERISGVSIDEETANMVQFQHAYDASARVMKTADQMFKSVLGIMG